MMAKRGGRGRWVNDPNKTYNSDHDKRDDNKRRVSFKNKMKDQKDYIKKSRVGWEAAVKLLDDDIDMSGSTAGFSRGNYRGSRDRGGGFRGGRLNSPGPRSGPSARKLIPSTSPWYQVTIPYGGKHDKDFILSSLRAFMSPDVFIAYYYKIVGNTAMFYVDDFTMAEKLFQADRKISMPDGFKLAVKVRSGTPNVNIDEGLKEKMKLAMVKRYSSATKALDLTKFHSDPDLLDMFCALFRPTIMLAVLDIIATNIPDLEALSLNENNLNHLDHLRVIPEKLKSLKILYIGNNKIQHSRALESIKGAQLIEILLEGNPFVERFKDKELYTRDEYNEISPIKMTCIKWLPCCKLLWNNAFHEYVRSRNDIYICTRDGVVLPPVINFDIAEDDVRIPPTQALFLCDPQGLPIVKQFLEQYYALYDSDSRQPLLDAYHENAVVSMTAGYGPRQNQTNAYNRLNHYFPLSRNLLRLNDREARRRHLKIGRLQVVSFLSELPKSQHDLMSFTVDLLIFTPTSIVFVVNGVFKERSSSPPPIRAFQRTFTIVPNDGGFCIKNDIFHITNATKEQEEKCFKESLPAAVPAVANANTMQSPPMPSLVADEATKMQLVQSISQQTGMNLHWSTNCLEQTGWDMSRGLLIFAQLHKDGKLPPEAFMK